MKALRWINVVFDALVIIVILALHEIDEQLHEAREYWGIGENCPCKGHRRKLKNGATIKELPEEEKENVIHNSGENCRLPEQGVLFICLYTFFVSAARF